MNEQHPSLEGCCLVSDILCFYALFLKQETVRMGYSYTYHYWFTSSLSMGRTDI